METMENLAATLYPTLETLLLPWLYFLEAATHPLLPAAQKIQALKAQHSLASKPQGFADGGYGGVLRKEECFYLDIYSQTLRRYVVAVESSANDAG